MQFSGDLKPYQETGVQLALRSPENGYAYFMDMGVGKTRTALKFRVERARRTVASGEQLKPFLVVCPLSVIDPWLEEIAKTTDLTAIPLVGTRARREQALAKQADVYIVNYEGLAVMKDALLHPDIEFDLLILDECHKVANRTTTQSKLASALAKKSAFVLLLSGTPVRNDARDLWHQLFVIDGGRRLGPKFLPFQAAHFVNVSRTRIPNWVPRRGSEDRITAAIADVCYRVKKSEVLSYLPPRVYEKRVVTMTDEQVTAYVDMAEEMVVEMEKYEKAQASGEPLPDEATATARTMLVRYLRLHQIAQGFLYDDDKTVIAEYEPNPKTKELIEILNDHDGKTIVWCIYRHTIENLMTTLNKSRRFRENGWEALALYGATTKNAGDIIRAFNNNKKTRVLIGQPQAGGLGVTLTAADVAVYFTNSWSHVERSQSEARNHREGSQIHTSVTYVDLVAKGTIDVKILGALARKADIAEVLTDFRNHLTDLKGVTA